MTLFFQRAFALLTTEVGSLAYHFVIAFAIASALPAALNLWRSGSSASGKRMVIGLSLVLGMRAALFTGAGIAWQGLIDPTVILPPLDRAVNLISLIIIVWLWAFPEPLRAADLAALLVSLLSLTMLALGIVWWAGRGEAGAFNGSLMDMLTGGFAVIVLGAGLLLLILHKPNGWGSGLAMLALLAVGQAFSLVNPALGENYSGAVRFTQMAAFPLLLLLPLRYPIFSGWSVVENSGLEDGSSRIDLGELPSFLALGAEPSERESFRALAQALCRTTLADLCLIVSLPPGQNRLVVESGFDLVHERVIPAFDIAEDQTPSLAAALEQASALHIPVAEGQQDLRTLADALNLAHLGELLAVPVQPAQEQPGFGILLLSPYSKRQWTGDDRAYLENISGVLAQIFQRSRNMAALREELVQAQQLLANIRAEAAANRKERDAFLDELNKLRASTELDRAQMDSLAAVLKAQEGPESMIYRLQTENENLRKAAGYPLTSALSSTDGTHGELRVALEEVAYLKEALAKAEAELEARPAPASPGSRTETAAALAQELQQPLASILGYADFLLGEPENIPQPLQHKFLVRIHESAERMAQMVDRLSQEAGPAHLPVSPDAVDRGEDERGAP